MQQHAFSMSLPQNLLVHRRLPPNETVENFEQKLYSEDLAWTLFKNQRASKYEHQASCLLLIFCGYCPLIKEKLLNVQVAVLELKKEVEKNTGNIDEMNLLAKKRNKITRRNRIATAFLRVCSKQLATLFTTNTVQVHSVVYSSFEAFSTAIMYRSRQVQQENQETVAKAPLVFVRLLPLRFHSSCEVECKTRFPTHLFVEFIESYIIACLLEMSTRLIQLTSLFFSTFKSI